MLQLNPILSFCDVGDRHVFLDLPGDRYFCLGGNLDKAWRAALAGSETQEQALALQSHCLVVETGGGPLRPCPPAVPTRSALDENRQPAPWLGGLMGAARVAGMRRRLRRESLAAIASTFIRSKASERRASALQSYELAHIAATFSRFDHLTTTLDQCLSRSLAVGFALSRSGFRPDIVLAVRLGPFAAHCWVECDGVIVNDHYDRVRTYRPIRRL